MPPLVEQFGSAGFSIIAFPCNQFRLQEPASNFEIDAYRSMPSTPPQPYAFMAKLTVNDEPVLCQPGQPDGSCNRGFPRCDDPNPDNCLPTSTRCCMANNAVYDYLTGVLPGEVDWNFVRAAVARAGGGVRAGGRLTQLFAAQAKFLIGRDGQPIRRYVSAIPPSLLAGDIADALAGRTLRAPPNATQYMKGN